MFYVIYRNFSFPEFELKELRRFITFILRVYIKYWFTCQIPTIAPKNDLNLLKELVQYNSVDSRLGNILVQKFIQHGWYLSESLIGLAFFDQGLDVETKKQMVEALKKPGHPENPTRPKIDINRIMNLNLVDFVSENTYFFFNTLFDPALSPISLDFLKEDLAKWPEIQDYIDAQQFVSKLLIVNDIAERGIALMSKFNPILTHQEKQKQFLLQAMEKYRRELPIRNLTKKHLTEYLKNKN